MKALVLSGGSIRGADQAGRLLALGESGWVPAIITATSVGAVNAAFLAAHPGTFAEATRALYDFWRDEVTHPSLVVRPRFIGGRLLDVIRGRWGGQLSVRPLRKLLERHAKGPQHFDGLVEVSVLNMETGEVQYEPPTADWALASAAVPFAMAPVKVNGKLYQDGGIRDVVPLRRAIIRGGSEIVVLACQSPILLSRPLRGDVLELILRSIEVMSDEVLQGDLARFWGINHAVTRELDDEHRHIPLVLSRPRQDYHAEIHNFTRNDIWAMLDTGYAQAREDLAGLEVQ